MPQISRRQALALAGSAAAAAAIAKPSFGLASSLKPRLPIPRLVEPDGNGAVALDITAGSHVFSPGAAPARTWGISADYLGPTIRLRTGTIASLAVANRLPEPTTLHWHGLMVPSEVDGGPHNLIAPGQTWRPELAIRQNPSTAWFHPHMHQETARHTYQGLAGMLIVSDGSDQERGLPSTYGVDDLPLIIQDRRLDGTDYGYSPDLMDLVHGFRGETIIVNGVVGPVAHVPRGIVRLRILNGANARNFLLAFADGRPFHVIASDGGYLAKPAAVDRLAIAPGERYEVLVDHSDGRSLDLLSLPEKRGAWP